MKEKEIKLPGSEHPISIARNPSRIVVTVAGRVIADTRNALTIAKQTIRRFNTFRVKMSIFPGWNVQITAPTAHTKAIAITTVFRSVERSPSMPCGRMRIRTPLLRRSRDTSLSTRTELMKSRSNFQRRAGP